MKLPCPHPMGRRKVFRWPCGPYTREVKVCLDCEDLLPLGPSSDRDHWVRVEIRATRIATTYVLKDITNEEFSWYMNGPVGIVEPGIRDPNTFEEWAGYLAHCIDTSYEEDDQDG